MLNVEEENGNPILCGSMANGIFSATITAPAPALLTPMVDVFDEDVVVFKTKKHLRAAIPAVDLTGFCQRIR